MMSSGLDKYNERLEEERIEQNKAIAAKRQRENTALLKQSFAEWLKEAENDASALDFWLWFKRRKNVIEKQRNLIDILN